MPLIKVLNPKEARRFDQAPEFNGNKRKKYFRLSMSVKNLITRFVTPHAQVGFLLHLGYFKATGRFYNAQGYRQADYSFTTKYLGYSSSEVEMNKYTKQMYARHKTMILQLCGVKAFKDKRSDYKKQLSTLIDKHIRPKNMLLSMIDWLRVQKIEVPTYNVFATSITELLNIQEKNMAAWLGYNLSERQIYILDKLMEKDDINKYQLTKLKYIEQSGQPGKIQQSVEVFNIIKSYFKILLPCIEALNLTADTWRNYAHWTTTARTGQLQQFSDPYHRYLYLIAFVYHHYCYRQDFFIKIKLNTSNKIHTDYKKYQQALHFQNKEIQQSYVGLTEQKADYYKVKWEHTCDIMTSKELDNGQKVDTMNAMIKAHSQDIAAIDQELEVLEKKLFNPDNEEVYFDYLKKNFRYLKNRMHPILETVQFNAQTSDKALLQHIQDYKNLKDHAFCRKIWPLFDHNPYLYEHQKPKVGLLKSLFYLKVVDAIKSGKLNLKYSYRYRSMEEYLIPFNIWKSSKERLLKQAGLEKFTSFQAVIETLENQLVKQYIKTNTRILKGKNPYVTLHPNNGKVTVSTPSIDKPEVPEVSDLLSLYKYTPIQDMLGDIEQYCNFMDPFGHSNLKHVKGRPSMEVFIAALLGYGCNIGLHKMGKISRGVNPFTLNNTAKWYLSEDNLRKANDIIVEKTRDLPIYDLFKAYHNVHQTASDGQKYDIGVESLNAAYSFKYFGLGKGVTVYGFIDEGILTFYSTVISPADREATYVVDGLMHNELYWEEDRPWVHHTDSHGVTDLMFAATNLLGISLSPRLKRLKNTNIYSFGTTKTYKQKGYALNPGETIKTEVIEKQWDTILRVLVSIRLKESKASVIFSRLSSYAQQNPTYQAFKELGKIYKSLFVLKYYDEVKLRQMTEKQLSKMERSNQYAHAIFFDNNQEIRQELKEDQDVVVAARVLIQNAIILWNCLKLSEKILLVNNQEEKVRIVRIIREGSACTWQHVNLQGIYEFVYENTSNFLKVNKREILDMKIA